MLHIQISLAGQFLTETNMNFWTKIFKKKKNFAAKTENVTIRIHFIIFKLFYKARIHLRETLLDFLTKFF